MTNLLSTQTHPMPAANNQLMSLVKLAGSPQNYGKLNGHEAVMAYVAELEQAGIPASPTLLFLQHRALRADHDITDPEFDHILTDSLRLPQAQLAVLRLTMGVVFAPQLVGMQPELVASVVSLGLLDTRIRACAARDNIEVQPYPNHEAPLQLVAAAAAAATHAAAAQAAAGANPPPPPSSVAGDELFQPTPDEIKELATAYGNADMTTRQLDMLTRLPPRMYDVVTNLSKSITKQRKQDRVDTETRDQQDNVWAATQFMASFIYFCKLGRHFNPASSSSKGYKPHLDNLSSDADAGRFVCEDLNSKRALSAGLIAAKRELTEANMKMRQDEEADPHLEAENKPKRDANDLALCMMVNMEEHLLHWEKDDVHWGEQAMRFLLCVGHILESCPTEGPKCCRVVPNAIFQAASQRFKDVQDEWETAESKSRGNNGGRSSSRANDGFVGSKRSNNSNWGGGNQRRRSSYPKREATLLQTASRQPRTTPPASAFIAARRATPRLNAPPKVQQHQHPLLRVLQDHPRGLARA